MLGSYVINKKVSFVGVSAIKMAVINKARTHFSQPQISGKTIAERGKLLAGAVLHSTPAHTEGLRVMMG